MLVEKRIRWIIFPFAVICIIIASLFLPWMGVTIDYLPDFYIRDNLLLFGGGAVESLGSYVSTFSEMRFVRILLQSFVVIFGIAISGYALLLTVSLIWVIKSDKGLKRAKVLWLVIGILLFSNQIFQLIYQNIIFTLPTFLPEALFSNPLTIRFTMGIGMVLLSIGSAILVAGYLFAKRWSRNLISNDP